MLVLGSSLNDRKSSRNKADMGNPKANRGCTPSTMNCSSAECGQNSRGPQSRHIEWVHCHTGRFNAMMRWKNFLSASRIKVELIRGRFRSLVRNKLRLCSANHRPGYWSNLPCGWLNTAWAYSEQETENGPRWTGRPAFVSVAQGRLVAARLKTSRPMPQTDSWLSPPPYDILWDKIIGILKYSGINDLG